MPTTLDLLRIALLPALWATDTLWDRLYGKREPMCTRCTRY